MCKITSEVCQNLLNTLSETKLTAACLLLWLLQLCGNNLHTTPCMSQGHTARLYRKAPGRSFRRDTSMSSFSQINWNRSMAAIDYRAGVELCNFTWLFSFSNTFTGMESGKTFLILVTVTEGFKWGKLSDPVVTDKILPCMSELQIIGQEEVPFTHKRMHTHTRACTHINIPSLACDKEQDVQASPLGCTFTYCMSYFPDCKFLSSITKKTPHILDSGTTRKSLLSLLKRIKKKKTFSFTLEHAINTKVWRRPSNNSANNKQYYL